MNTDDILPESATSPTNVQFLYLRFVMAVLIDLVVLNLFNEYWASVTIDSFTVSLFAALMLQVLLKLTLHIEHRVATWFKTKPGRIWTLGRFLAGWPNWGDRSHIGGNGHFVYCCRTSAARRTHPHRNALCPLQSLNF